MRLRFQSTILIVLFVTAFSSFGQESDTTSVHIKSIRAQVTFTDLDSTLIVEQEEFSEIHGGILENEKSETGIDESRYIKKSGELKKFKTKLFTNNPHSDTVAIENTFYYSKHLLIYSTKKIYRKFSANEIFEFYFIKNKPISPVNKEAKRILWNGLWELRRHFEKHQK